MSVVKKLAWTTAVMLGGVLGTAPAAAGVSVTEDTFEVRSIVSIR